MAAQQYIPVFNGEQIVVTVAWTANTMSRPALINDQRAISSQLSTNTDYVPNLNDPSQPDQTVRTAKAFDYTITGSGMIDSIDLPNWLGYFANAVPLAANVYLPVGNAGTDAFVYSGSWLLTKFDLTGKPHSKATASMTLEPTGPVTTNFMANALAGGAAGFSVTG
jgi:hypothetical protein